MKTRMTREELLRALLVERFGTRPQELVDDDSPKAIRRRLEDVKQADLEADRRVKDKPA